MVILLQSSDGKNQSVITLMRLVFLSFSASNEEEAKGTHVASVCPLIPRLLLCPDGSDFKVIISNAKIQTLENGSLTIREVDRSEAGHYMCQGRTAIVMEVL